MRAIDFIGMAYTRSFIQEVRCGLTGADASQSEAAVTGMLLFEL